MRRFALLLTSAFHCRSLGCCRPSHAHQTSRRGFTFVRIAEMSGKPEQTQAEPGDFRAILTPYRSLGPTGFLVLMSALALLSFVAGLGFYLIGAWPVLG